MFFFNFILSKDPKKNTVVTSAVKQYTKFLRKKIKEMGRMPTHEENKKYYAEFSRLQKRVSVQVIQHQKNLLKRKNDDDRDWTGDKQAKIQYKITKPNSSRVNGPIIKSSVQKQGLIGICSRNSKKFDLL